MNIGQLILFVSSTSPACRDCMNFISSKKMPIMIVRLDTKEARQQAMNGRQFSIKMVPTLLVVYENSNIQLFVGTPKIVGWLQQLTESREQPEQLPIKKPKKKTKKKSKKEKPKNLYEGKKKQPPVEFYDSDEDSEESEEEIEYLDDVEEKPSTEGLIVGAMSSKSSGKKSSADIMSLAKQMEKERKNTLGYDESQLPKSS